MSNGRTELVFILDKSGSMAGLESDTIGGYNSVLAKQKSEPGACRITTVLFDPTFANNGRKVRKACPYRLFRVSTW